MVDSSSLTVSHAGHSTSFSCANSLAYPEKTICHENPQTDFRIAMHRLCQPEYLIHKTYHFKGWLYCHLHETSYHTDKLFTLLAAVRINPEQKSCMLTTRSL
jgi:hypothetical protein